MSLSTRRRPLLCTAALGLFALSATAQSNRGVLPVGSHTNALPKPGTDTIVTTDMNSLTPLQVVQALLGQGVSASNIVLNGAAVSAGTFQSGLSIVGIDNGIVLSSGDIGSIIGPNASDDTSTDNLTSGDAQLDLLTTSPTYDACTLEFDFTCTGAGQISFQYVFSSEEYNEFVNSQYNDVFAFFLNGVNIATLPGGTSVAINNVHCGNPYGSNGSNCGLYLNNSCADLPIGSFPCSGPFDTEMDGLTVVLTATGTLLPGNNHIKLAIADAGDSVYDSNVFIRGQSFSCGGGGAYFAPPTPCGQTFQALVGTPVQFTVAAAAATGLPGNSVTLAVGPVPAGAVHTPSLPILVTGQNVTASTSLSWTPTASQIGPQTFVYTAMDQLNQVTTCTIQVNVNPVGSGNASATTVGVGCVPNGQYPELRCDPPVIGTTVDLEIRHGLPNWLALHLCSIGAPVPTQLFSGCMAYVDVNNVQLLFSAMTNGLGGAKTPWSIPNAPYLAGLPLTLQSVFLQTSDPYGLRGSDGLYLVLGF
jgi:hypothetical protein